MNHTKGPWSVCGAKDCKCGTISCADYPIAQVTSGEWGDEYPAMRRVGGSLENHYEAYIERIGYGKVPEDEAKANARLISAAPDLLEALQGLLDLHVAMKQGLGTAAKKSIAAIAKATHWMPLPTPPTNPKGAA